MSSLVRLGLLLTCCTACAPTRVAAPPALPPEDVAVASSPPVDDADAFRLQMPAVSPQTRAALPTADEFELRPSGTRVVVQKNSRLPLFAVALMFAGGSATDPVGKEGLAAACMAAWIPEASQVQGQALSWLMADLGVGLAASAGDTYSLITMRGPAWHQLDALRLLQYVALPNNWMTGDHAAALARAKQRLKLAAKAAALDSERLATRLLRLSLFGASAAEIRTPTIASIDAISTHDCAAYHDQHLTADQLTIVVAGDVDADVLSVELQRDHHVRGTAFAHLPKRSAASARAAVTPATPVTARPKAPPLTLVFLHVPEAAQTQVVVGHRGPPPSHGAYLPTVAAMQALGGAGNGRLVSNLREHKGFGYYAKYSATTTTEGTAFGLHASVEPGAAWITALEMLRERRDVATNVPIGATELATIVINRTQLVYEAFARPQTWIMAYVQAARLQLPMDYLAGQVVELATLSPDEIYATMQQVLTLPTVVVIVGDGDAPQYAPALIPGWNPRVPRMRAGEPVTLRQALQQWATHTGADLRDQRDMMPF